MTPLTPKRLVAAGVAMFVAGHGIIALPFARR